MKKPLKSLLLLLFLSGLLFFNCEKVSENGVIPEPIDSSAVFNLVASDSLCLITPANGSFLVGEQLTGNQNIQVEVVISKPGKWSLSTDTLNGFSFAGSGLFADTGKQLISLNALGTPVTAGNFFFSLINGSLTRFFAIAVLKGDTPIETVPLESYFKGNIGGVEYVVKALTNEADDIAYGSSGGDTASFSSFLGPGIYPTPPGTGTISLQKNFIYNYLTSTEADFKNFFKPGAYAYANKCRNVGFPGMILFWSDSQNQGWGTLKEFGDQTGSSFAIVGIEDGHNKKGKYFIKVKSRFNCKLYKLGSGEMQELKDGELVSFFIRP